MSSFVRNGLPLLGGATVLVLALVWLSGGCREKIAPIEEATVPQGGVAAPGRTAPVREEITDVVEDASGTLASERHTTVSSKILARIEQIPVRAGAEVREGDLLVRLDGRDLQARARAAREEVRAARAAVELALSEKTRVEALYAADAATRQQLDRASTQREVTAADLEGAEQRLRDSEIGLSYAEIRSPVSGRVIDRLAEPGDTAAPGAPLLRIYDPGRLRLEAPIRESIATRLAPGQSLRVSVGAVGVVVDGEIDEIVPYAEPGARTFLVKIRLPSDPRLYAGMFGRVAVPAGQRTLRTVPATALNRIGQLEYVLVLRGEDPAERRLVTTGPTDAEGRIEVLSGLVPGEVVILGDADRS
jgi:RND family efflux transporter MFP subunit